VGRKTKHWPDTAQLETFDQMVNKLRDVEGEPVVVRVGSQAGESTIHVRGTSKLVPIEDDGPNLLLKVGDSSYVMLRPDSFVAATYGGTDGGDYWVIGIDQVDGLEIIVNDANV
jgi:hypothetical protein